jgi:hypothetical protein
MIFVARTIRSRINVISVRVSRFLPSGFLARLLGLAFFQNRILNFSSIGYGSAEGANV